MRKPLIMAPMFLVSTKMAEGRSAAGYNYLKLSNSRRIESFCHRIKTCKVAGGSFDEFNCQIQY
jgi:hypothetical protein